MQTMKERELLLVKMLFSGQTRMRYSALMGGLATPFRPDAMFIPETPSPGMIFAIFSGTTIPLGCEAHQLYFIANQSKDVSSRPSIRRTIYGETH
jgi:hypothetical protein